MEQTTPKKRFPVGGIIAIILVVLLLMAAGAYCGLCKWVRDNGRLLPMATVSDGTGVMDMELDLGQQLRDDALEQLTAYMDGRLEQRTLTLSYDDGKTAVLSGSLLAFDPVAAVDYAMTVKASQPFLRLGALWLGLVDEPVDLSLSASSFTAEGEEEVIRLIDYLEEALYVAPVDYTFAVDENLSQLTLTFGSEGRQMVTDGFFAAIQAALVSGQAELDVPTVVLPSAELNGVILAEQAYVAPLVSAPQPDGTLSPTKYGYGIDVETAQSIMDAYVPGEEPCTIPLIYFEPDITEAEPYLFQDLLATVTTNMDGVASRSFNVARAAQFCNNYVLLPTEVFSYIGAIGNPSVSNGYQTSTGYYRGETVEMEGGGVCQVSSSIYYCTVYANLEIVKRAAHAFSTGYIPNGLDATIYYPSLDFKFRNNTDYPIKIVTTCSENPRGQLTVSIYGTKADDSYVTTEINTLSTTPWETKYQPDPEIPVGTTKVKTTPYTGYTVEVYRVVRNGDGSVRTRTYENYSRYAKRDKVILFNPEDAERLGLYPDGTPLPPPEPEPEPEPTDDVLGW